MERPIDRIIVLVHRLMLVLFVGWGAFFVYVLVRFRQGAHPVAHPHGLRGNWSTWIEGGVLAAEVILLVFFAIPTWSARVDAIPPAPAAKDDITTIDQLNLPVDRPVVVYLSSKDVLHSFGLPQMRIKQDAIPGLVQPVWFTPTRTGEWEIACSQLCGLGHYRMRGFYSIQAQADYDAWLTQETAALTAP